MHIVDYPEPTEVAVDVRSIRRVHPLGGCVSHHFRAVHSLGPIFGDHLHNDTGLSDGSTCPVI